ncbi:MAG: DNRLRE domain-containing protein [Pseudomonadota bacterium]
MRMLLLGFLLLSQLAAAQTTVTLSPTIDNSIFSESDNSGGGDDNLFIGITAAQAQNGQRRALLAFQDLAQIPGGATITAVELNMAVTRGVGPSIPVAVFETTSAWTEGTSTPTNAGGAGAPAADGGATWRLATSPNDEWTTQGGDFDPAELTQADVNTSGSVTFPSTAAFVARVQSWVDGETNNGLILISQSSTTRSAKRLGSRENASAANRPTLAVTFTEGASDTPLAASGLWFDAALPGDGFNVIESAPAAGKGIANSITVFYFGYDATGARLWLVSDTVPGPFLQDQTLTLPMLLGGTSGDFQTPAPGSELTNWGTLDVTLSGCTTGVFELSGIDGNKRFEATQLTAVSGISCGETR